MEKEYIDLCLPSGTLWAETNENEYYNWNRARKKFGDQLPTKKQFRELLDRCTWTWDSDRKGFLVTGRNGNSIFFPAAGERGTLFGKPNGKIYYQGKLGRYVSSSYHGFIFRCRGSCLVFVKFFINVYGRCNKYGESLSVRLVKI
jgi:hypothetical protein